MASYRFPGIKLLRSFLTFDCFLHLISGALIAFALVLPMSLFGLPAEWVTFSGPAAVAVVVGLGVGREIAQAWDDSDGDRWPWQWSQHRLAEALAWLPGAVVGVVVQAMI